MTTYPNLTENSQSSSASDMVAIQGPAQRVAPRPPVAAIAAARLR
jgi:hypothetical protein